MKTKRLFTSLILGLGLAAVLLVLLAGADSPPARATAMVGYAVQSRVDTEAAGGAVYSPISKDATAGRTPPSPSKRAKGAHSSPLNQKLGPK